MNRKVLLIEPNYSNKYPPMGLMKISTYFRKCGDDVRFFKGDLREFAATLLGEEYFAKIQDNTLGRYYPEIVKYIRYGKKNAIEDIPQLHDETNLKLLEIYRLKYKKEQYPKFDFVGVTTLFTFYWQKTISTVNFAKKFCKDEGTIEVGGIASTILPDEFYKATGIYPHVGLLDKPGVFDEGNTDIIDELPLDYSILDEIDYKYPASDAYFGYMTRGCIRNCAFCAVKTLEPNYKEFIHIKKQMEYIDKRFGPKRDLLLMDNNVLASRCFDQIIDEIIACGYGKGATYLTANEYQIAFDNIKDGYNIRTYTRKMIRLYDMIAQHLNGEDAGNFYIERENLGLLYEITATPEAVFKFDSIARPYYNKLFVPKKRMRHVDFNQGIDARLVNDENMKQLSKINIKPLRIAFDHYEQKDIYIKAIRIAAKYGIKSLSNYLLYNFLDKPEDLYYRMKINVDLCKELNVTIYSFPMKYHPIKDPKYFMNRDYLGEHWNRKFIRAIQCVLNSTKGKVGRSQTFFEEAFGRNVDEFFKILWMPEEFIIYRRKYDKDLRSRLSEKYIDQFDDSCDLANEWWKKFSSLSAEHLNIAKEIIALNKFDVKVQEHPDIEEVLSYYRIKT